MVDVSGIPNLGIPAMGGFNSGNFFADPNAGLNNAYASQASNNRFFGQQANTLAAAQVPQAQLYGPLGFGGQTALSAATGAAYGRATGGFGGYGAKNADPFTPVSTGGSPSGSVTRGPDLPDLSPSMPAQPPIPYLGTGGGDPFGGGGFSGFGGRGGVASMQPQAPVPYMNSPPPGSFSPTPNYPGGSFSAVNGGPMGSVFNQGGSFTPQPDMATLPMAGMMSRLRGGGPSVMAGASPEAPPLGAEGSSLYDPSVNNSWHAPTQAAAPFRGGGRDFNDTFGQMPQSLEDQLQGILRTIDQAQGQPSPPYLPPAQSGDTLTAADRGIGLRASGGDNEAAIPGLSSGNYFGATPGGGVGAANSNAFFGGGYRGASGLGQVTPGGPEMFNNAFSPGGGSFADRWGGMQAPAYGEQAPTSSGGGIGSDMLRGGQNQPYDQPWHSLIPGGTPNTPEIIKQINYTAGRGRYDPAALANVIDTESKWDPKNQTNSYFGATQIGPDTFREAGGRLGGMNFGQYKNAPLEQQIPAYGDWLQHYARPGNAAGLASSGISSLPVEMQSAILQGTQFGPNSTQWPAALGEGNMSMRTTPYPQAGFLGKPPTINSMNSYFGGR